LVRRDRETAKIQAQITRKTWRIENEQRFPRSTKFAKLLKERYKIQHAITTYGFDDTMKDLEREKFLEYAIGKWRATRKALATISKYHGA
jgi:hypothetical protein